MGKTSYKEYWATICKEAKEKTDKKLGLGIRIFGILIGVISTVASSLLLGKDTLAIGIIALTTIVINIVAWIIAWTGYFTYFRAKESVLAYNGLEDAISRKQDEIDNLTKDTKLKIATIPDLFPLPIEIDSEKKYIGLEVHNLNKDKKILELGAFSFAVFSHTIAENGNIGDSVFPGSDFTWTENLKTTSDIRPDGKSKLALMFINENNKIDIGSFSGVVQEETFFEMEITFKGRYQGETHFREHKEIRVIYFSKEGKISFSNTAINLFSDMNPSMKKALSFINDGTLYINRHRNFDE